MKEIRIATSNPGKLREFREMLSPLGFSVKGLADLSELTIVEDGDTFEANAIIKAKTVMEITGCTAIADDSGIVVDALEGRPGVHSARYAGVDGPRQDAANRTKMLDELQNVPTANRTARFVCALALCRPDEAPVTFRGTFEGSIGFDERGNNGFGYDSIFLVKNDHRTSAELSPDEKNAVSHRGEALKKFSAYLQAAH